MIKIPVAFIHLLDVLITKIYIKKNYLIHVQSVIIVVMY